MYFSAFVSRLRIKQKLQVQRIRRLLARYMYERTKEVLQERLQESWPGGGIRLGCGASGLMSSCLSIERQSLGSGIRALDFGFVGAMFKVHSLGFLV